VCDDRHNYLFILISFVCFCLITGSVTASPYSFYLFPEFGADIAMSVSSIDFLRYDILKERSV
jgi:hypothetical protein